MGHNRRRQSFFAAALAAACLGGPAASHGAQKPRQAALTTHDGVYSVEIFTLRGSCDRVYRWTINVAAGRVTSPADGFMQASGQINQSGVVSLAFRRDEQVANVAGKVNGGAGSGTWSSPTLQCAGSWRAARQS
jgi:hypothetical protein